MTRWLRVSNTSRGVRGRGGSRGGRGARLLDAHGAGNDEDGDGRGHPAAREGALAVSMFATPTTATRGHAWGSEDERLPRRRELAGTATMAQPSVTMRPSCTLGVQRHV
jgi:hypothetical protein